MPGLQIDLTSRGDGCIKSNWCTNVLHDSFAQTCVQLTKNEDVVLQLEAAFIHSCVSREACNQGLLLRVDLTCHRLKVLALHHHSCQER